MKKILSLLLLALIGVNIASAQVTATCNGKEVQDGDEIVFYAHADDFGEISINPESQGKEIFVPQRRRYQQSSIQGECTIPG